MEMNVNLKHKKGSFPPFFMVFLASFALVLCTPLEVLGSSRPILDAFVQQSVQGSVADENGEPLLGVSVVIKGTTVGTVTDFDGNFELLDVPDGSTTIVVSYVGMKTQEVPIDFDAPMQITLAEDAFQLDEMVVVGYGTTIKSDLTGAVSSVSSEDFEKQPVSRVEEALQGRASGVQVTKNSGAPGADIRIRVRGSNSINGNNQPLIVLDGVIGADLRSINTNDIASMEILKDASATAIYGSRGANGVILVTTKRGRGESVVDIDLFTSFSSITKEVDILSPQEFGSIFDLPVIDGGTDYQKAYFRTGITKNLQVSARGKGEKIGYFVSGNVLDQTGTAINSDYTRYSLRSNLDINLTDKLSAQVNLYGSNEKTLNLVANGTRTAPDVRGGVTTLLGWDPTLPIRDSEGNYNLTSVNGSGLINPIAQRLESESYTTTNSINANINLSYDITDELNLTVIGGILYDNNLGESYNGIPAGSVLGPPTGGGNTRNATTLQNSNILTWDKKFGKSNFKFTGLYELQSIKIKDLSANGGPFSIPANFYSLDLGTTPTVRANLRPSEIESWMARGEYNLDRNLFLTATIRRDKSSRFRPGNQVGYFPSGSIAYQFRDLFDGAVERLKLRGGYGETGNQNIPPYTTFSDLNTGRDYPLNGTALTRGFILGNLGNADLTWETTKQTNVGVDATFLNGRLNLTLNKYWKNTTDLLLNVPLPTFAGGGSITRNVGEVFNGGWEVSLDAVPVDLEKFSWNFNLNYSYNQSEVKALSDDQTEIFVEPVGSLSNAAGPYVRIAEGEPLGDFYGATFLGTFKTGDPDGTPGEANYLRDAEDAPVLSVIGNGVPTHTWALNNTFTWGDFDLNFLLRGVHDFDVLNVTRGAISQSGGVQSLPTFGENRNRWTPENQTDIPTGGDHFINSTRFIEKGDFIRLSNLAIGYNVKDINFGRSLRVYASAQNLFTITDYQGYDPEASSVSASEGTASSIDYGAYPNSKTFTIGLKLGF